MQQDDHTLGFLFHAEHTENKPDDIEAALQTPLQVIAVQAWTDKDPTGLSPDQIKEIISNVVLEAKDPKKQSGYCSPELRKILLFLYKKNNDETTKNDNDLPKRQESRMLVLYAELMAHLQQHHPHLVKLLDKRISVWYEKCSLPINRFAQQTAKTTSDAKDIAQEVLMLLGWEVLREVLGLVTHKNLISYLKGKVRWLVGERIRQKDFVSSDPQSIEDNDGDATETLRNSSGTGPFSPLDIPLLERRIERNVHSAKSPSKKDIWERRHKLFLALKKFAHHREKMPGKAELAEEIGVSIDTIDSDLQQIAELAEEIGVSIDTIDSDCEQIATQNSDAELPVVTITVTQNGDTQ